MTSARPSLGLMLRAPNSYPTPWTLKLLRKQEGDLEADTEILRSTARALRPVATAELELHLLGADRGELGDGRIDRYGPLNRRRKRKGRRIPKRMYPAP